MKRLLSIYLLVLLICCAGCSNNGAAVPSQTAEPVETVPATPAPEASVEPGNSIAFTDALGRTVEIPENPLLIAPGNAQAQAALYSLAPDRLAGWFEAPGENAKAYINETFKSLPVFGDPASDALDRLALQAAGAEVIFYIGGETADAQTFDAIEEELGLPVVYLPGDLNALPDTYRTLGGLFGMEEEAEDIALYLDLAIEDIATLHENLAEGGYRLVYYGGGADGLTALSSDCISLAGGKNAAEAESEAKNVVTPTDIKAMDPYMILLDSAAPYDKLSALEGWKDLECVQMGRFYEVPSVPFNWVADSCASNTILGVKWLMQLTQPELCNYDMLEEVKAYFDLFWHKPLTDAEAEALLETSTLKPVG